MGQKCKVLVPEDFLYTVLNDSKLRDRFSKLCFMDLIKVRGGRGEGVLVRVFVLQSIVWIVWVGF